MSTQTTPFQIGEEVEYFRRVVESPTQLGQTGKVVRFRFPEEVSVFGPIVIYVDLGAGVEVAFHADELRRVPTPAPDHGPLAATLSDRTLDKVLSRPAYVPSGALLDRDAAAQRLADAVSDLVPALSKYGIGRDVRQALAEYRSAVQS